MSIVILERETGTFRPSRRDEARGLKVLNYDGLSLKCTNSIILFGRGKHTQRSLIIYSTPQTGRVNMVCDMLRVSTWTIH